MGKILLCPFCGGNPSFNKKQSGSGFWMVSCKNPDCAVIVETRAVEREEAIQQWNHRAIPPQDAT